MNTVGKDGSVIEKIKEILEKYEALSKAQKEMIVDLLNVMFRHFENI